MKGAAGFIGAATAKRLLDRGDTVMELDNLNDYLYAATKKANELMGHTYSHLFNVPTTGLRFCRLWALGAT